MSPLLWLKIWALSMIARLNVNSQIPSLVLGQGQPKRPRNRYDYEPKNKDQECSRRRKQAFKGDLKRLLAVSDSLILFDDTGATDYTPAGI